MSFRERVVERSGTTRDGNGTRRWSEAGFGLPASKRSERTFGRGVP